MSNQKYFKLCLLYNKKDHKYIYHLKIYNIGKRFSEMVKYIYRRQKKNTLVKNAGN